MIKKIMMNHFQIVTNSTIILSKFTKDYVQLHLLVMEQMKYFMDIIVYFC